MAESGAHRTCRPVEAQAIVHSNKLDILLNVCDELGYGHVFAQDDRAVRGTTSLTICLSTCVISTTSFTLIQHYTLATSTK